MGDSQAALRLYQALVPQQVRVLGPNHSATLATGNNIAYFTLQCGEAPEALQLFQKLLPDQERMLGLAHPATLRTRERIDYLSRG